MTWPPRAVAECSTYNSQHDKWSRRPGKGRRGYRGEPEPRWQPEIIEAAMTLRARGVSRQRICHFFCIGYSTYGHWLQRERQP